MSPSTSTPKRIQRRRTKGWRMPAGAVYVGRPTKWGNPFAVGDCWATVHGEDSEHRLEEVEIPATAEMVVMAFRRLWHTRITVLQDDDEDVAYVAARRAELEELRGHDLACFCPLDQPCHADVLLVLANSGAL